MAGVKGRSGGRNRLPTALKRGRGTLRNDRRPHREIRVVVGLPDAPPYLTDRGREIYERLGRRLVLQRVMTHADGERLALLASDYDEWQRATDAVRTEGAVLSRTTKDGSEVKYRHPDCINRDAAWRRFVDGLAAFGLDPRSRDAVSAIEEEAGEPGADFFQ